MNDSSDNPTPKGSMDLSLNDLKAVKGVLPLPAEIELKWRLFEKRFDYAWDCFDFHAKQRMTMFNYFLIFVGFVITGYANLLKDGSYWISTALALVGAGLTVVFVVLERRNEELVNIAEDVLESLESDVLFDEYEREILWPHRRERLWGPMKDKRKRKPSGIFRRQSAEDKEFKKSKYEHGKWLPRFQLYIIVMFLVLAALPWIQCT